ncbi:uncharacterized protein P174DRAFT_437226 [Aspergillus novofumigatus IBT 16806]|uniref:Uncharacterized protein n=1 Tax=Aspergillus novofumigatus (strain IBT 16806) TaxID=1392255 RepID=A0A2I1CMF8_ASPN1|nr:uncharacterized protein P174DRAFT_437226 [Aspergillus novofumigatus IBT 16806]PKX98804.1 hypothetical protein P174DRAFT_437226 [Aspergillus novofumigatus IBT 16806]
MTFPKLFPLLGGCNLFPTSSSTLPCTRYNATMGFVQGQSSCTTSFPPLHNYRSLVLKPSNLKSWHSTNEMTLFIRSRTMRIAFEPTSFLHA